MSSLSRKTRKTRKQQFIHAQYLFNCKVQALLAMATILTSILEYENTVILVGEEYIHTYHSYEDSYNVDKSYFKRLGRLQSVSACIRC